MRRRLAGGGYVAHAVAGPGQVLAGEAPVPALISVICSPEDVVMVFPV